MLTNFTRFDFAADGYSFPVYRQGEGPPVIVLHEIPGPTPAVIECAQRIVDDGFTVFLPHLFGKIGEEPTNGVLAKESLKVCISREFGLLAQRKSSPIMDWVRSLSRYVHEELGGVAVGALGMCVTGNFALSMLVDPWVMAPVLSQPSLPLALTKSAKSALHISDEERAITQRRVKEENLCVLAMRFTEDRLVPHDRFEALRDTYGENFVGIEIESGNETFSKDAHSVITTEFIDEAGFPTKIAMDRVLEQFHTYLG